MPDSPMSWPSAYTKLFDLIGSVNDAMVTADFKTESGEVKRMACLAETLILTGVEAADKMAPTVTLTFNYNSDREKCEGGNIRYVTWNRCLHVNSGEYRRVVDKDGKPVHPLADFSALLNQASR